MAQSAQQPELGQKLGFLQDEPQEHPLEEDVDAAWPVTEWTAIPSGSCMNDRIESFERHRSRLQGIAYRMLGSRMDAEDAVQETYLRWHRAATDEIRLPEAWLVTAVTRLCIDRLREARTQRETYVGPWLPEPIVGMDAAAPTADEPAELASSLSIAFLAVLERLAPEERAAFLLHEVFDSDYSEIAQILGKNETTCRQIVSRARKRVRQDRPRVQVSPEARRTLLERFVAAVMSQDKDALMNLLAADATWTSDGGGKARAARKVIRGRELVARFVLGAIGRRADRIEFRFTQVNEEPGLALFSAGRLLSIISMATDGARILAVFSVLNPEKLRGVLPQQ
jgi:RNA polymerase sigma-70 factor (ECF subfamily)